MSLKKDDLDRLNQNNLLNDTLIEVGLRYWLWDLSMRIPALGETVPEESYTHVKNWTRKNKINVDIFSKDFIVIPIHEQSHWYLAIIHRPFLMLPYHLPTPASPIPHNAVAEETDVPQTTIYILDSLNGHHPKVAPRLSSYLQHEARERHNCSNISDAVECIVKVPQQPNSTDCGVYLLHFAETFVERYNSSFAEASTVLSKASSKSKRPNNSNVDEERHNKKQKLTQDPSRSETRSETQDNSNDEDDEDNEDEEGYKCSGDESDIRKTFKAKKGEKKKSRFQPLLSAARLMPSLCHPYPNFYDIFEAGLVKDSVTGEGDICDISDDAAEVKKLLKCYNFLKKRVGESSFNKLIFDILSTNDLSNLVHDVMTEQVSDAIGQDIRYLKDIILEYAEDALGDELHPRIKRTSKKSDTRGYHHPQLARLLVPTSKLQVFIDDPQEFCNRYNDNDLADGPITSTEIPSFFYADLGFKSACDQDRAFDGLLQGWLIIQTLVHLYLGDVNASEFREHYKHFRTSGQSTKFKVKQVGLAHTQKVYSVTMEMLAYTTLMIRHALSSCNDRRSEEGDVVKVDAYNAVMAIIDDPDIYDEEFITELMDFYAFHIGWMLPVPKRSNNLKDAKNPNCGLNQLALLKKKRAEANKAEALKKAEEDKQVEYFPSPYESEPASASTEYDDDDDDGNDEAFKPISSSTGSDMAPSSSSPTIVYLAEEEDELADEYPNITGEKISTTPSPSKPQPEAKSKKAKKGKSSTSSGQKFQPLLKPLQAHTSTVFDMRLEFRSISTSLAYMWGM
ncbi:hypothetical protein D9757_006005 [Collybiopsis confluens]|uniref:Ubiquitin-like protease family profile domain-containing protein n=1 Tax=Collybiopsis confluens TaxID=2823264 RepID=A0A8H5HNS6_9AGAR|nr:hypothetical protein D9757_011628 [Collybiopsis confluens]KAF5386509.1 hypothetical protein D9757_005855 [Collybiopsis confluens]KAF5389720.1 hypothetical protein D9757_006005 [Collybiopsis confluens]